MSTLFQEGEDEDELLLEEEVSMDDEEGADEAELEISLEDVEELEEEENIGHKVQTYDPSDDGTDNYFDERYFDE